MIYFIQHGKDGPIKISYTTDDSTFHSRLSILQTGSPVELMPLGIGRGARSDECELHQLFAEEHIRGEWFHPDDALLRYIHTRARKIKKKSKASSGEWEPGFDDCMFIRCHKSTKDKAKDRAEQLGIPYSQLMRWGLRWLIHASREELLKYSVEVE